jgi:hypothetical protein
MESSNYFCPLIGHGVQDYVSHFETAECEILFYKFADILCDMVDSYYHLI